MKKNRIWSLVLFLVLALALSACGGARNGEVSHANYKQIIEGTTTYNEVIVLQIGRAHV